MASFSENCSRLPTLCKTFFVQWEATEADIDKIMNFAEILKTNVLKREVMWKQHRHGSTAQWILRHWVKGPTDHIL